VVFEETVLKKPAKRTYNKERAISTLSSSSNVDNLKEMIDSLVIRNADNLECKACGKTTKTSSDIRRHVEIHIQGLSFDCNLCDNTFRSRASLKTHKQTHKR